LQCAFAGEPVATRIKTEGLPITQDKELFAAEGHIQFAVANDEEASRQTQRAEIALRDVDALNPDVSQMMKPDN